MLPLRGSCPGAEQRKVKVLLGSCAQAGPTGWSFRRKQQLSGTWELRVWLMPGVRDGAAAEEAGGCLGHPAAVARAGSAARAGGVPGDAESSPCALSGETSTHSSAGLGRSPPKEEGILPSVVVSRRSLVGSSSAPSVRRHLFTPWG